MKDEKLLPCPHCNTKGKLIVEISGWPQGVACRCGERYFFKCGVNIGHGAPDEEARKRIAAAWNKRARV